MTHSHLPAAFSLALGLAFVVSAWAADGAASAAVPSDTHARLMAQLREFQTRQHPAQPPAHWKPGVTVVVPPTDGRQRAAKEGEGVTGGGAGTAAPTPQAAQR